MEKYIKAVNKHFNLDIRENTRKFEYVVARACYYKICREVGGYTYHRIAMSVNKTHATVLHSLAELPNIIKYDYNIGKKCKDLFSNYDFLNKKEHKKSLKDLLVDYNIMIIENDQLKMKIEELTETIYQLADLE